MPKTRRGAVARKNVRIPEPIMDEVDGIVRDCGTYVSRQQFIESAVREKIERIRIMKEGGANLRPELEITAPSQEIGGDFSARVKDTFLAHAILNTVREKTLPANHLDPKKLEENIRRYIEIKAERDGRKITKKNLDELTEEVLRYHNEILEGLNL